MREGAKIEKKFSLAVVFYIKNNAVAALNSNTHKHKRTHTLRDERRIRRKRKGPLASLLPPRRRNDRE